MPINYYARQVYKRIDGKRLLYYMATADHEYWDRVWISRLSHSTYDNARKGKLPFFLNDVFTEYLPKNELIIEAGCGTGHLVLSLRNLGYRIEGIEWAETTVGAVKAIEPDLPINIGDVRHIQVPDEHYAGYISIGVVEHEQEGPESFLQEAWRVLKPGAVMLISVPYFNALRKAKAKLGFYRDKPENVAFYQYVFTEEEFISIVQEHDFEIVTVDYYSANTTLSDEIPFFYLLLRIPLFGKLTALVFHRFSKIRRAFSHMILIVAKKKTFHYD